MNMRHFIIGCILFSSGLAIGGTGILALIINDHPIIIVRDEWRTVTTTPTTLPDSNHTSLNPDEIKTILGLEGQPDTVYLNPKALPIQQVPPSSAPPITPSTVVPKPVPVKPTAPAPIVTQPPSTLPPSSTTLSSETTTVTTQPPQVTTSAGGN